MFFLFIVCFNFFRQPNLKSQTSNLNLSREEKKNSSSLSTSFTTLSTLVSLRSLISFLFKKKIIEEDRKSSLNLSIRLETINEKIQIICYKLFSFSIAIFILIMFLFLLCFDRYQNSSRISNRFNLEMIVRSRNSFLLNFFFLCKAKNNFAITHHSSLLFVKILFLLSAVCL